MTRRSVRLLAGLGVLFTVNAAVAAVRVTGLVLDGPGPFTLQVLKPEGALVALSAIAFLVERRRRQRLARHAPAETPVLAEDAQVGRSPTSPFARP